MSDGRVNSYDEVERIDQSRRFRVVAHPEGEIVHTGQACRVAVLHTDVVEVGQVRQIQIETGWDRSALVGTVPGVAGERDPYSADFAGLVSILESGAPRSNPDWIN